MKIQLLIGLCAFSVSGVVYAECPDSLNVDQTIECLSIEGADDANYQDWLVEFNQAESPDLVASNISPITGQDIRLMKPAAGGQVE